MKACVDLDDTDGPVIVAAIVFENGNDADAMEEWSSPEHESTRHEEFADLIDRFLHIHRFDAARNRLQSCAAAILLLGHQSSNFNAVFPLVCYQCRIR